MKALKKLARRGRLEGKGQFASIYGLAAGGARAAMHERGAPEEAAPEAKLPPHGVLKTTNVSFSGYARRPYSW
jgi:hypothetical protein